MRTRMAFEIRKGLPSGRLLINCIPMVTLDLPVLPYGLILFGIYLSYFLLIEFIPIVDVVRRFLVPVPCLTTQWWVQSWESDLAG